MADMILSHAPRTWHQRLALRTMSALSGLPLANLHDVVEYQSALRRNGFSEIRCHDVSDDVFAGFGAFVEAHYQTYQAITSRSDTESPVRLHTPLRPATTFSTAFCAHPGRCGWFTECVAGWPAGMRTDDSSAFTL